MAPVFICTKSKRTGRRADLHFIHQIYMHYMQPRRDFLWKVEKIAIKSNFMTLPCEPVKKGNLHNIHIMHSKFVKLQSGSITLTIDP